MITLDIFSAMQFLVLDLNSFDGSDKECGVTSESTVVVANATQPMAFKQDALVELNEFDVNGLVKTCDRK